MFAALIQGEGVLAKSKSQIGLGTMQAWFPTGEPIRGCGSCVPTLAFHWPLLVGAGPTPCRTVSYITLRKNNEVTEAKVSSKMDTM